MGVYKLPSKRWRAQIHNPATGRNVSAAKILRHIDGSYPTKKAALAACADARKQLGLTGNTTTVGEWARRWATDPLFARPKASTNLHNAERVKAFVHAHGTLRLDHVDDRVVSQWLAGGKRNGQVSALRAMFNDAASSKGGRLIERNPFAGLGIAKTRGNRDVTPPDERVVWDLIRSARENCGPGFSAWLQVACFTGLRPGELDALRWAAVDLSERWLRVVEQFSQATGSFTLPKNGLARMVPITPEARQALIALPRSSEFVFVNFRGGHWTASGRAYHWKATRAAAGYTGSLYLATRHFAGSYMTNVLGLPSEDVAIMLGHQDGGELVRRLYGHRDRDLALARVRNAYEQRGNVRPIRTDKLA